MRFHPFLIGLALLNAGCGSGDSNFTKTDEDPKPVDGESIMEVSATELNWTDMEVGQTYSKDFTISSTGEVDLQLYEARILVGGDVFYLPEVWKSDQTIARGGSVTMTLTASLDENEPREGSMRIKSNDSTNVELLIPLTATPLGWGGSEDTGGDTGEPGSDTGDSGEDTGGASN